MPTGSPGLCLHLHGTARFERTLIVKVTAVCVWCAPWFKCTLDVMLTAVCGGMRGVGLIPVARKLRATRARDMDERLELATQLVKQAYSECPNLDLLIKAILTSPLYRLSLIHI